MLVDVAFRRFNLAIACSFGSLMFGNAVYHMVVVQYPTFGDTFDNPLGIGGLLWTIRPISDIIRP